MEPLPIAEGAVLRPFRGSDAAELTAVVDANRGHLARWLPWASSYGHIDSTEYIARKVAQEEADDGFEGAIVLEGRIVGAAGFHRIDRLNRATSIGYWLTAEAEGRGLMTAAVRTLLDHAFGVWELHRVVIEVVVDNARSRAIPERLGFTAEGVQRQAKRVGERYEDAILYAMLAPDWSSSAPRDATGKA
jgi:ribosomal-protein-serine acetyltransferase